MSETRYGDTVADDTHVAGNEAYAARDARDVADKLPDPQWRNPVLAIGGAANFGVFAALLGLGLKWYEALGVFAALTAADFLKRAQVTPHR
jgi:hypothetical protein